MAKRTSSRKPARSRKSKPSIHVILDLPPKTKTSQPGSRLTIYVHDDENITTYLSNLLQADIARGWGSSARRRRRGHPTASLDVMAGVHQTIRPAIRQFWEDYTGANAVARRSSFRTASGIRCSRPTTARRRPCRCWHRPEKSTTEEGTVHTVERRRRVAELRANAPPRSAVGVSLPGHRRLNGGSETPQK